MRRVRLLSALSLLCGLALWEVVGRSLPRVLFAPASAAFLSIANWATHGTLGPAIGNAFLSLLAGFVLATAIAVPLGYAMGRLRWLHELLDPVLTAIYAIPPVAFIPFVIVWFGLFFESRVAIVFIMCFFEMLVVTIAGARSIDRRLIDVARSFDASRWHTLRAVTIPASMPFVFTALRVGLVRAVAGMITAELLLAPVNLGKMLLDSAARFDTAGILGIIVVVALMGVAVQQVLLGAEHRLLRWEPRQ